MAEPSDARTRSLPLRTLAAGLIAGAAGWALARAVIVLLANISVPSFDRVLLPAQFAYGTPAGWSGSTTWAWVIGDAGVLLLPFLFNASWLSRRLLSVAGLVKYVAALLLLAVVASAALIGSDVFTAAPWGGGAARPLAARVVLTCVAALSGGVLFALFGEGMAAGAPDRWIAVAVPRTTIARAFISGALVALTISLLAFAAADAFNLLFRAVTAFLGESAEVSPLGWARLERGLVLDLGLLLAATGALLTAASPGPAERAPRLTSFAVAAVPAAALLALAMWFRDYCRTAGEMDRTFAQAAGLETAPASRLMLLPGAKVLTYSMTVALPGLDEETAGASTRNVELAEQYLRSLGGRWTAHTIAARHMAPLVHERLLEPEAALRARADAAEATGSVLSAAIVLAKAPRMPLSDAVRDVTARLRDTTRFRGGSQAKSRLEQEAAAPHDRSVTGTIDLPADQGPGTRVALYRQVTANLPTAVAPAVQLVAAATPDARGRFVFDGLPPAFYSVAVLLPERMGADTQRVAVTGSLRVVDLSSSRRGDAGTVGIRLRP